MKSKLTPSKYVCKCINPDHDYYHCSNLVKVEGEEVKSKDEIQKIIEIAAGKEDMTAKEFFDSPECPFTLDRICTPLEKEFLLEMIELYAKGKVHQAKNW